MTRSGAGSRQVVSKSGWLKAGVALLIYGLLLALVAMTTTRAATDSARDYLAQASSRSPRPLAPLPVLQTVEFPDLTMQRDPFQQPNPQVQDALPRASPQVTSVEDRYRFIASYLDREQKHALARSTSGRLAQFPLGAQVNGGLIVTIGEDQVMLDSNGRKQALPFAPVGNSRRDGE